MRIAYVVPYFHPAHYGGTPKAAYDWALGLVHRGHEVTVFTTDADWPKRIRHPAVKDGIQIRTYRNLSNWLAYRCRMFLPLGLFLFGSLDGFDIVHIHEYRNFLSVWARFAARRAKPLTTVET